MTYAELKANIRQLVAAAQVVANEMDDIPTPDIGYVIVLTEAEGAALLAALALFQKAE